MYNFQYLKKKENSTNSAPFLKLCFNKGFRYRTYLNIGVAIKITKCESTPEIPLKSCKKLNWENSCRLEYGTV